MDKARQDAVAGDWVGRCQIAESIAERWLSDCGSDECELIIGHAISEAVDAGYLAGKNDDRWVVIHNEGDLPTFETDRDCWFAYRDDGEPVKVYWRHDWDAKRKADIVARYSAWVRCFVPSPYEGGSE
jgi:hypothetical protein